MTNSLYEIGEHIDVAKIKNKDGFVFGKTHNNNEIAIFVGNRDIKVYGSQMVNVEAYIVSTCDLYNYVSDEFTSISFKGGSLNNIYPARRLEFDSDNLSLNILNDTKTYEFELDDQKVDVEIDTDILFTYEQNGEYLKNAGVTLTLTFEQPQPIRSVFKHYSAIKNMLSFMCFRKEVGFEKIQLLTRSDEYEGFKESVADVFICDKSQKTIKDWRDNICIDDLGLSFPEFVKLFYSDENEGKTPISRFLPLDDSDVTIITPMKVKEICSSLETEYSLIENIQNKENEQLEEIKRRVHRTIKECRKMYPEVSDSTYNLMFSSVANWSLTLKDKIVAMSDVYAEELMIVNISDTDITPDSIGDLVKYRNNITHSNTVRMTKEIANTAYNMQAIVYFCVLTRIGVSREKIKEMCIHHRFLR